ncbi:hypothetical protein RUND412_005476 [Rhizina undulata]
MSEYWKSTPKYWCKNCKAYVTDTPISRKNHDATPKHQGNLKRFLRDLHRSNERDKNAADAAKREVARLNALTDNGEGSSSSASVAKPSAPKPWAPPPQRLSESERKRQLKELEDLGVALPEEYRGEVAMAGEWKSVEVEQEPKKELTEKEKLQVELVKAQKRKWEEEEEQRKWNALDEDEKAIRGFQIATKTYPGMDQGLDHGAFIFKGKGKAKDEGVDAVKKEQVNTVKEEDGKPEEKEPEVDSEDTVIKKEAIEALPSIKTEDGEAPESVDIKKGEGAGDGVVFKKRKVKNIRKK